MYGGESRSVGARVVVGAADQALRRHLQDVVRAEPTARVVGDFEPWDGDALRTIRDAVLVLVPPAGPPYELTLNLYRLRGVRRYRIVAVVDQLDDDRLLTALARGGVTGIIGPHDSDELRAAVMAVADGYAYLTPIVASRVLAWLSDVPDASLVALVSALTPRQRDVLDPGHSRGSRLVIVS